MKLRRDLQACLEANDARMALALVHAAAKQPKTYPPNPHLTTMVLKTCVRYLEATEGGADTFAVDRSRLSSGFVSSDTRTAESAANAPSGSAAIPPELPSSAQPIAATQSRMSAPTSGTGAPA